MTLACASRASRHDGSAVRVLSLADQLARVAVPGGDRASCQSVIEQMAAVVHDRSTLEAQGLHHILNALRRATALQDPNRVRVLISLLRSRLRNVVIHGG